MIRVAYLRISMGKNAKGKHWGKVYANSARNAAIKFGLFDVIAFGKNWLKGERGWTWKAALNGGDVWAFKAWGSRTSGIKGAKMMVSEIITLGVYAGIDNGLAIPALKKTLDIK